MNTTVTVKWLVSILGPVSAGLVWLAASLLAPVQQRAAENEKRIDRHEQRIERRLERIETKVDRLLQQ